MNWHKIELTKTSNKNSVHSMVQLGKESHWFSGHFPDESILPGFAVLSMVYESIVLATEERLTLKGFKKIRFKQVIKPGDRIEINADTHNDSNVYSFTVYANGNHACKGSLIVDSFDKT